MLNRLHLAASFALFATLAAPLVYAQQVPNAPQTKGGQGGGPGGGPGGPGGGPGGMFGGGPGGMFGGRGGQGPANDSVERLVQIEAVQEDLKIDDKTKAKIKTLGEDAVKERTKRRDVVTKQAQAQAAELAAAENARMAEMLAEQGISVDPKTLNNNNNGGPGRGGRGGPGGGQANQFTRQMMTLAMADLQAKVDAAMLKLLDAKQKVRIKQIILQQEGARAFTTPNQEVVDKLALTEEQLKSISDLNNQIRGNQRQAMQDFTASFAAANGIDTTNNGGGGGGGRGGFPNMQNLDPAIQAKFFSGMQDMQSKTSAETMVAIGNLLTKSQKATYNKMIGDPFDVSKLRGPAPGAPGGPGGPPAPATAATQPATKAATPPADAAAAKPAAKKNTLKDRRGDN